MSHHEPPRLARLLLRLQRLGSRRDEIDSDLRELFEIRAREHGVRYARSRYYGDVFSLWRTRLSERPPSVQRSARIAPLRDALHDLSYAGRLLRRSPGIVTMAVLGLAIAISVCTTVLSILNAALLRPTGIEEVATAVGVQRAFPHGISTSFPFSVYSRLRDESASIRLDALLRDGARFRTDADVETAERADVTFVTGGYLENLSRGASIGRLLTAADDRIGAPPALVVSHRFWVRRLGGDPDAIGRTVWLNDTAFTLVGVAPRRFSGTVDQPPAAWAPLASYHLVSGGAPIDRFASTTVTVVGRLANGVSRAQAEAELGAVAAVIGRDEREPGAEPMTGVVFIPAGGQLSRSESRNVVQVIAVVLTAIGLVLLLACVNVANLLLASASSRAREIGMRLAIGASRSRIVRQLLTESLALGLLAGLVSLLFTVWLLPTLVAFVRAPLTLDAAPNVWVYLLLAAISIAAGLGSGLAPARHALRGDVMAPIAGVAGRHRDGERTRFRPALIGAQSAASITLLILAALLTRGMIRATQIDVGFNTDRLLVMTPAFGRGNYDAVRATAYWNAAIDRVRAIPGVASASLAEYDPFGSGNRVTILSRAGARYTIYHNGTRADYFTTLGLRVTRGRIYAPEEVASRAKVLVISETIARDFFPGEDPIGQSVARIAGDDEGRIIGVVSDLIANRLRALSAATIYQPLDNPVAARLVIATSVAPQTLVQTVRSALQPIDPRVRLEIRPVSDGLRDQIEEPRIIAALAGSLAAIALALAIVGLYGVTSFFVGLRRHEIGVRIAMGASTRDIVRLLTVDGLRPLLLGLAVGVVAAFLGGRVVAGALYGLAPSDPISFVTAACVLLATAAVAVLVPVRRAMTIDPASVLRVI